MTAGPSGLPEPAERERSTVGFFWTGAAAPEFFRAPPRIHCLMTSSFASGSLSWLSGMAGSSWWVTKSQSQELSRSPGSITAPLAPPAMRRS
ncbi:MAG: hypothetical protein A2V98_22430 [Planctomycetes bacterium RBG_16_64_12]|nr:MAG: hypothetical protein A2V98_22430 [Planctomycetes bacterium RBG_16_64_12]